jgi:hypothetical protein
MFFFINNWKNICIQQIQSWPIKVGKTTTIHTTDIECCNLLYCFAYVAHFASVIDVWIRPHRDALANRRSNNLATDLPLLSHPSHLT